MTYKQKLINFINRKDVEIYDYTFEIKYPIYKAPEMWPMEDTPREGKLIINFYENLKDQP